jgi:hypothetical protein
LDKSIRGVQLLNRWVYVFAGPCIARSESDETEIITDSERF